jgi:hypothetical protein
MPKAEQALKVIRIAAKHQPLRLRIIRSVASSSAIETGRSIASIEVQLLMQTGKSITRRQVKLA